MRAHAPRIAHAPGVEPAPAAAAPAAVQRRREKPCSCGHDLASIPVHPPAGLAPSAGGAPAAGGAPIQAAGLFEAYKGLKGRAGRAYDAAAGRVAGAYGGVKRAVTGTRAYRAAAGAYRGVRERGARLSARVNGSRLYRGAASIAGDVSAIGKDVAGTEGFQKARALAGVLGLAGGYRQGYGEQGGEARAAFRGRWEKYFESLPPEKRAQAMERYTLAEPRAGGGDGGGGGGGDLGDIEMQELGPRRGGGGRCSGGGQVEPPESRFDRSGSSGGSCPDGGVRFPSNRFGD